MSAASSPGRNLRHARIAAGLTPNQLARRSGVGCRTIEYIESGRTLHPSTRVRIGLARALGEDVRAIWPVDTTALHPLEIERHRRNLSLRAAARAIGISPSTLRQIERGEPVHPMTSEAVADFYADVADFWGEV
jgi:transcriptional regulator with XRE-family HTH domain